jgi:hypothetical protein
VRRDAVRFLATGFEGFFILSAPRSDYLGVAVFSSTIKISLDPAEAAAQLAGGNPRTHTICFPLSNTGQN